MAAYQKPKAIFMAFGTKGDVFPIAAIASAFACDQKQYQVVLITHRAHQSLMVHLAEKNVNYIPVNSPPVLSVHQFANMPDSEQVSFPIHKKKIQAAHREECLSVIESVLGDYPNMKSDFIVINFFALEGWHLSETFQIRCVVASPYVVPYSAPSAFVRQFKQELPLLYKYFQEAPPNTVSWKDVAHWMWPLFTNDWGSWRSEQLKLSPIPFIDAVTSLPMWHMRAESPLLIYGFSKEIVECPDYWPPNTHACGFWFLPLEWQFSCNGCREIVSPNPSSSMTRKNELCATHADMQQFLTQRSYSCLPIFIGLSSIGSMGFLKNPHAFLRVLEAVIEATEYHFILLTAGYEPLDACIKSIAATLTSKVDPQLDTSDGTLLFSDRLYCFSGSIPYSWLFLRCAVAIHHGGSGSTAAALHAGIPQIICPFILDQFYWAERLHWIGVAPEPLRSCHLLPENINGTSIIQAADDLARTIKLALSPEIKAQALRVADMISSEDGLQEAVKILKEKVICPE
ncbi:sterol 3-beta-glucosyltransferase UGT80B1-like isoform X1 [Zingiber officinale]|uniref:sterol 3-beta-glucosyltransferase UGT80B1-like isoform X1 n=2 Tax=Zingiber officinale TaxID=94328 RepID=UPI001C4BF1EF|nr:sterol 3-beta-glucosyltransferase UGT80B1-like isoform X1 [Zingiber officinale]XP_042398434.1 sterol 3-beta-glucosyltransferase UGT80B1-like isoform X1 [Zingiber officinale]